MFPVPAFVDVPDECAPALESYERSVRAQWPDEALVEFGYFEFPHGRSTLRRRRKSTIGRIAFGLSDFMDRKAEQAMGTTQLSPLVARYFMRESLLPKLGPSGVRIFLSQLTYLRSIQRTVKGRPTILTYPPSLISNLVVAVLPGRVVDESGCSLAQDHVEFASSGRMPPLNSELRESLNRTVTPALLRLWAEDSDSFEGARIPRGTTEGFSSKASIVRDGEDSLEPLFSSVLFQSGLFDPAAWQGDRRSGAHKRLRLRDFCMVLTPYEGNTIVVLQYPISTSFSGTGQIEESRLQLDEVAAIVQAVASWLSLPGAIEQPAYPSETHPYLDARASQGLPVPPFEAALRAATATSPTTPANATPDE